MPIVTDDHLLLTALAGTKPDALRVAMADEVVYTTGCWYYRLEGLGLGHGSGLSIR